jgi:Tfp pilus assembly protein PilN
MKVRLNLATKGLQTHRKFLGVSGLVGVGAAIFFLGLGWHVYSVRKSDEALRVKVESIRAEMVVLDQQRKDMEHFFAQPENAKLHDRSAFLNTLIDEQSLNWTQMFMDLEKILPGGVRILTIAPTFEKGRVTVKLTVGAASDEAKLKFLHALESSPAFTHVELINTKKNGSGAPGLDPTEIELDAVYSRT